MGSKYDKKKARSTLAPISLEDFSLFFCCKAFDSVGNGSYRPHLHACRDRGEDWAIEMYNSVNLVQAHVKHMHHSILSMPNVPCNIAAICKDVMLSSQPPVRLFFGSAVCSITSRVCSKCLDLSRNNKDTARVYVDLRFGHFFMMIWFCSKIEYIIRCLTRMWVDNNHESLTYTEMCKQIKEGHSLTIERLHKLFIVSEQHVTATLNRHISKCMYTPILQSSAEAKAGSSLCKPQEQAGKMQTQKTMPMSQVTEREETSP